MIVADTNLIAYLLLDGENTAAAEQVLLKDHHWIAPLLWRSEFRNILATYMRQGLLALEDALRLVELAETFLAGREHALVSDAILKVAERSGCAAYDCEFVVLAEETGAPLVTSDKKLLATFPDVAVDPASFVA